MGTPKNTSFLGVISSNPYIQGLLKKPAFFHGFWGSSRPPHHLVHHPKDAALPVFFAGDALREPFWPMGEGCSRGFMGAFDTVWTVRCNPCRKIGSSETSWWNWKKGWFFIKRPPCWLVFSMVFLACILTMFNFRHISPPLHHYLNCMDFLLAVFKTWYIYIYTYYTTTPLHIFPIMFLHASWGGMSWMPCGSIQCPFFSPVVAGVGQKAFAAKDAWLINDRGATEVKMFRSLLDMFCVFLS